MRDRGKREFEAYNNNNGEYYQEGGENMIEFPCKKHPTASSSSFTGGICAYCLTDRLYQLVCPECGEQRIPSCSCSSDVGQQQQQHGNNASARISFLLENEKKGPRNEPKNHDFSSTLKRSNSICVENGRGVERGDKKSWKFSKLFTRKKKEKNTHKNNNLNDENKSEVALSECIGVSRSRSLCSFRGFYDTDPVSSSSAARASSVSTGNFVLDSAKRSCFSESEARISNFDYYYEANKNIFSVKESEFVGDDPAFIDLKLHDMSSDSKMDVPVLRRGGLGMSTKEFGSCRVSSVSERELRKCKKSYKVWKWFFRHQNGSSRRRDQDQDQEYEGDHHGFRS